MLEGHFEVVPKLISVISSNTGDCRHLSLLSLNNLSIPLENKKLMTEVECLGIMLPALMNVIASDASESYLACIALMNMSFLESAIVDIACFDGFLSTIEKLLQVNKSSSEGTRWACGLLKNLSRSSPGAAVILNSNIPRTVLGLIAKTTVNSSRWANHSMEDFVLFTILNLSQYAKPNQLEGAIEVVKPVVSCCAASICLSFSLANTTTTITITTGPSFLHFRRLPRSAFSR
jgi:hypothetical protein